MLGKSIKEIGVTTIKDKTLFTAGSAALTTQIPGNTKKPQSPSLGLYKTDWNMILSIGHRLAIVLMVITILSSPFYYVFFSLYDFFILAFLYFGSYSALHDPKWLTEHVEMHKFEKLALSLILILASLMVFIKFIFA